MEGTGKYKNGPHRLYITPFAQGNAHKQHTIHDH